MISKTKISKRLGRKSDSEIVETIMLAKKEKSWMKVAQILSGSKKNYDSINLKKIDSEAKEGDTIVVVGKVLGSGQLTKKVRISATGFSESAREKIEANKSEIVSLIEEIKKNPKAEGIKILR